MSFAPGQYQKNPLVLVTFRPDSAAQKVLHQRASSYSSLLFFIDFIFLLFWHIDYWWMRCAYATLQLNLFTVAAAAPRPFFRLIAQTTDCTPQLILSRLRLQEQTE